MPVLVERFDISKMHRNGNPVVEYSALIREDSKQAAILYHPPTGKEPVISVKFDEKNKQEVRIYVTKENTYIPVWQSPEKLQLLTSDENEDDFLEQRIATLTPKSRTHRVEIKKDGNKTGSWVVFRLIDPEEN